MTYGSLFSGAGGFDIGFDRAGFRCVWQVECEPSCVDVLARHWPDVPRCRDVTGFSRIPKRHGYWLDRWVRPDVVIGGFPCQDLSVAGQRNGIEGGSRSGLFYQLARIVRGLRPRFMVFENVAGLLSSDRGGDLLRVVRKLAECGYHGGWRTLDARFFGVAQRRRRVFGVFARHDIGIERVAEILAFTSGVSRHPATGRTAGQEVAGTLGGGSGNCGWRCDTDPMTFVPQLSPALKARDGKGPSSDGDGDGDGAPLIAFTSKDHGADAGAIAPTLRAMQHHGSHANGGGQMAIAFTANNYKDGTFEWCSTARPLTTSTDRSRAAPVVSHTLTGNGFDASEDGTGRGTPLTPQSQGVRRLTPRECERLQGWPDDHTRYRSDGREIADGPRYKMIGNGVASPVAEWLARRIAKHL